MSPRTLDFEPDWDLHLTENWRNQGAEENPILISNFAFNVNFEKPDSVLKEKENWRNKGKRDDVLLNQSLKFASTFAIESSNKRKMEKENRKPSKYFKPCPDIHIHQNVVAFGKRYADVMLLKNGSKFQKHIEIGDRRYIVTNTCSFDTIAKILAVGASDCIEYFNHLELSTNDTCGFILRFHGLWNKRLCLRTKMSNFKGLRGSGETSE